jgi:hypothetical protein
MDGRLSHEVIPFTGRRYCIIWYKVFDRRMTRPAEIFEPAEIIYERQAVNPMNNLARSSKGLKLTCVCNTCLQQAEGS